MKHLINTLMLCIIASCNALSMELELHKNALRAFTPSTPQALEKLQSAVTYIQNHASADPQGAMWLKKCALAQSTIIPHIECELEFNTLINQEYRQENSTCWPRIKELLQGVSCYTLNDNDELRERLIILRDDTDATHEAWLKILEEYHTPSTAQTEEDAPPLPPLPALELQYIPAQAIDMPAPAAAQKATQKVKKQKTQPKVKHKKKQPVPAKVAQSKPKPRPVPVNQPSLKEVQTDAFWLALLKNDTVAVKELLNLHAKTITLEDHHHTGTTTPLASAITEGFDAMCELLLMQGANPNTTSTIKLSGKQGWLKATPIALAIKAGKPNILQLLLEHNADPNIPTERVPARIREYPLCIAARLSRSQHRTNTAQEQQKDMIKLLLLGGATVYSGDVLFFDKTKGKGFQLLLNRAEDQGLLPSIIAGTERISCHDGNISLIGTPYFSSTEEENSDQNESPRTQEETTASAHSEENN